MRICACYFRGMCATRVTYDLMRVFALLDENVCGVLLSLYVQTCMSIWIYEYMRLLVCVRVKWRIAATLADATITHLSMYIMHVFVEKPLCLCMCTDKNLMCEHSFMVGLPWCADISACIGYYIMCRHFCVYWVLHYVYTHIHGSRTANTLECRCCIRSTFWPHSKCKLFLSGSSHTFYSKVISMWTISPFFPA